MPYMRVGSGARLHEMIGNTTLCGYKAGQIVSLILRSSSVCLNCLRVKAARSKKGAILSGAWSMCEFCRGVGDEFIDQEGFFWHVCPECGGKGIVAPSSLRII